MLKTFKSLENKAHVRKRLHDANVYQAVEGKYSMKRDLDRNAIKQSPNHSLKIIDDKIFVELNKDAPDYEDMFITKNVHILPPDEVLEFRKNSCIKIPIVDRDELPELPDSDLLKALHYYTSKKLTSGGPENKRYCRTMDETALLAFGMIIEDCIDELIDENSAQMFLEPEDMSVSKTNELMRLLDSDPDDDDEQQSDGDNSSNNETNESDDSSSQE